MNYIKVKWIHNSSMDPIMIYSELDSERWEKRKVEVFHGGRYGYADIHKSFGSTRLGKESIPELDEIASDPQFEPAEITEEEFEEMWMKYNG